MHSITSGRDLHGGLKKYKDLLNENAKLRLDEVTERMRKSRLARQMGQVFHAERIGEDLGGVHEILAADYSDPKGNLGTLSGSLMAQKALEAFKYGVPELARVTTDFSADVGYYGQTEVTRIVVAPQVDTYDATLVNGRPNGWVSLSAVQTTDVSITMSYHLGLPVVFDSNTLAAANRNLFEEQAVMAAYAIGKQLYTLIYGLMTPANFAAYAAVSGAKVPLAYAKFSVPIGDFGRGKLIDLAMAFNLNEVPVQNRTVFLNSPYFAQLSKDPSLVSFFAAQRAPEAVADNELPKVATFVPMEAPNFTTANTTANLVGFAMQCGAIVAKTRVPMDYTAAMPEAQYGRVVLVTDPVTGMSLKNVQYTNHLGGYSESRLEILLGAAVGDTRGGLCITSQ